jgi:hypothetical protein
MYLLHGSTLAWSFGRGEGEVCMLQLVLDVPCWSKRYVSWSAYALVEALTHRLPLVEAQLRTACPLLKRTYVPLAPCWSALTYRLPLVEAHLRIACPLLKRTYVSLAPCWSKRYVGVIIASPFCAYMFRCCHVCIKRLLCVCVRPLSLSKYSIMNAYINTLFVCACVCMCLCMYGCMHACLHIYIYIYIYIYSMEILVYVSPI